MPAAPLHDTALRYFLEVVRCGSVSEAAVRLCVSGSAVSRQVAGLEDALGAALFERRPRGMVPSAAGEVLAVHARRVALEADRVVDDIEALKGLRRGRVRLASTSGFAIEFLPRMAAEFRQRYPGIRFQLQVAGPAEVTAAVLRGDADIGLTYSRAAEQGIEAAHRQATAVLAVMRPDHPLARRRRVTLAQLQPHAMALPGRGSTVRQLFDIGCGHEGRVFEPVFTSDSFEALGNFVLHAGAVSIAGEITVRHRMRRGELCGVPIRAAGLDGRAIELQTLRGRTLPEGVRGFLAHLRQQLPDAGGQGDGARARTRPAG